MSEMNPAAADALQKHREEIAKLKEQGIVIARSTPTDRWEKNKTSLRACINAYCWQCSCEQKSEVTNCHLTNCPLWLVRPYQKKTEGQDDADEI